MIYPTNDCCTQLQQHSIHLLVSAHHHCHVISSVAYAAADTEPATHQFCRASDPLCRQRITRAYHWFTAVCVEYDDVYLTCQTNSKLLQQRDTAGLLSASVSSTKLRVLQSWSPTFLCCFLCCFQKRACDTIRNRALRLYSTDIMNIN